VTVVLAGLVLVAAWPGGVAPIREQGVGGQWRRVGPQVFLDRLMLTPDSRWVVAGGSGLFIAGSSLLHWHRVGPFSSFNPVLGLSLPAAGGFAALVGAGYGLYGATSLDGRYQRLGLAAGGVHAAVVVPGHPTVIWASSDSGMWRSSDGGEHFAREDVGLRSPGSAWALYWWQGTLYGSDDSGVYRWDVRRWLPSSDQFGVVSLDPGGTSGLVASSMGDGVMVLREGHWSTADRGLPSPNHGPIAGIHVVSVSQAGDDVSYASTMLAGVAVSTDGGRSWAARWPGLGALGVVWRVLPIGSSLLVATDSGLRSYQPPPSLSSNRPR